MTDEHTIIRWLITVGGALAGLVGLGVSIGSHKQKLADHERRISAVEQDMAQASISSAANGLAIARLEASLESVLRLLERIENKLDRA